MEGQKKKQKLGFPIKDFGNDGGGGRYPGMPLSSRCPSFLNVSIRNLNYLRAKNMDSHLLVTPAILKPGSTVLKTFGCLIKDFRHDERGGFPPEFQAWRKGKLRLFFFPSLFQRGKKEGGEAIAVRRFRLIRGGK